MTKKEKEEMKKKEEEMKKERIKDIIDALEEFENEVEFAIHVAMAVVNPYDDNMYDNDKLPPLAGVRNVMQECLEGKIKKLKEQLNTEENK